MVCYPMENGVAAIKLSDKPKDASKLLLVSHAHSHCSFFYYIQFLYYNLFPDQVNRSHTLQAQGTKNTAATELATQCRPTSFPCCLSNYPPPALPQRETLPPFPEGFRARCHSSITKSESPRMSSL